MKYDGLKYQWVVNLSNGTDVSQFNDDGENEVLFKDIRDKDISKFWLMNVETRRLDFGVDLKNGKFFVFGKWVLVADGDKILSDSKILKYRLIYFRQVTKVFAGMSGPEINSTIVFFIGWQANSETGQNIKKLLQIHDSKTIAFG